MYYAIHMVFIQHLSSFIIQLYQSGIFRFNYLIFISHCSSNLLLFPCCFYCALQYTFIIIACAVLRLNLFFCFCQISGPALFFFLCWFFACFDRSLDCIILFFVFSLCVINRRYLVIFSICLFAHCQDFTDYLLLLILNCSVCWFGCLYLLSFCFICILVFFPSSVFFCVVAFSFLIFCFHHVFSQ